MNTPLPASDTPMPDESLQAILRASPFQQLFDMNLVSVAEDDAVKISVGFTGAVERNAGSGQIHGGLIAALGDIAGSYVVGKVTGRGGATVHYSVDFLRPAIRTGLTAHACIRRLGKTLAFVDVDIVDDEARPIAICRGVYSHAG